MMASGSFLRKSGAGRRNLSSKKRFHSGDEPECRWVNGAMPTRDLDCSIMHHLTIHLNLHPMTGPGGWTLFLFPVCLTEYISFLCVHCYFMFNWSPEDRWLSYSLVLPEPDSDSTTLREWKWLPLFLATRAECPKFARLCTIEVLVEQLTKDLGPNP